MNEIVIVIDIPYSDQKNLVLWCHNNLIPITFLTFIQGNRISYKTVATEDVLTIMKLKFFDMKFYHYIN
jgi:hypothetical protein